VPKATGKPVGRTPVQVLELAVVYLKMLAQYPSVQLELKAGKLGSACKGSPSEHEISTGARESATNDKLQLSQLVWAFAARGRKNKKTPKAGKMDRSMAAGGVKVARQ
jgi:hypothetical protein